MRARSVVGYLHSCIVDPPGATTLRGSFRSRAPPWRGPAATGRGGSPRGCRHRLGRPHLLQLGAVVTFGTWAPRRPLRVRLGFMVRTILSDLPRIQYPDRAAWGCRAAIMTLRRPRANVRAARWYSTAWRGDRLAVIKMGPPPRLHGDERTQCVQGAGAPHAHPAKKGGLECPEHRCSRSRR